MARQVDSLTATTADVEIRGVYVVPIQPPAEVIHII